LSTVFLNIVVIRVVLLAFVVAGGLLYFLFFPIIVDGLFKTFVRVLFKDGALVVLVMGLDSFDELNCRCVTLKLNQESIFFLGVVAFHL
jgi:hypothetical protein